MSFFQTTGFFSETQQATDEKIVTVTGLVYRHAPDHAEELLHMLGLLERIPEPETPDLSDDLTHCASGRHTVVWQNRYRLPSGNTACLLCKRDKDNRYRARKKEAAHESK